MNTAITLHYNFVLIFLKFYKPFLIFSFLYSYINFNRFKETVHVDWHEKEISNTT